MGEEGGRVRGEDGRGGWKRVEGEGMRVRARVGGGEGLADVRVRGEGGRRIGGFRGRAGGVTWREV